MTNLFKNARKKTMLLSLGLSAVLMFTGCSATLAPTVANAAAADSTATSVATSSGSASTTTTTTLTAPKLEKEDSDATYKTAEAVAITLSGNTASIKTPTASTAKASYKNGILTISSAGTYVIKGSLTGQIVVNAAKEDKVHIVFNGVNITSKDGPAVWIKQTEKLILTLADGTLNTLTDSTTYSTQDEDGEPDATLYSKEDLSINGKGSLIVNANYGTAIRSKDSLIIASGNITLKAKKHGLNGKDEVGIFGGTFNINATEDAIHSKTQVYIKNGTFTINAGDDGIHADSALQILGGTIDIQKSYEGLEAANITISGGNIKIKASDDGINAAGGNDGSADATQARGGTFATNTGYFIKISGGTLAINADGDGLDANGSLYISGGTTTVSGPTNDGNGPLDYDQEGIISGGTLIAAGSSGMAQAPQEASTQASIMIYFSTSQAANSSISLVDSTGKTVLSYTSPKAYKSVVFSSPSIKKGATYTLVSGGKTLATITPNQMTSAFNSDGSAATIKEGMGGMGGPGGQRPEGNRPTGTPPNGGQVPPNNTGTSTDGNTSATKK